MAISTKKNIENNIEAIKAAMKYTKSKAMFVSSLDNYNCDIVNYRCEIRKILCNFVVIIIFRDLLYHNLRYDSVLIKGPWVPMHTLITL